MRIVPAPIKAAIASGVFVGETRLVGRVTVQPDWYLNTAVSGLGKWDPHKTPIRWWQNAANDQTETEIPGVVNIDRDKSIDSLAPTVTISILNQTLELDEATPVASSTDLGFPGYLTPTRGEQDESRSRWGQIPNEWEGVLLQNALIRVYQGIAGPTPDLGIHALVDAGYLMERFVGLIDSVDVTADGKMSLSCRGMTGPLLIDQKEYVPLIPLDDYPFERHRWSFKNVALNAAARDITTSTTPSMTPGDRALRYLDSSTDHWSVEYGLGGPGSNSPLHGHYPADSCDGLDQTWWVSNGNSRGDAPWAYDWLEFDTFGDYVNAVFVEPFAGNYQMFISVMENGSWQGGDVIPYDPSGLYASQAVVNTGANIPYVAVVGVPWEQGQEYELPRAYAAQRIRLTFHNETYMEWGPWFYRAGVREVRPRISGGGPGAVATVQTEHFEPIWLTAAPHTVSGYITSDGFGVVDAFGEARVQTRTADRNPTNSISIGARMTLTGLGYYVLEGQGRVVAYGDAVHYGDLDGQIAFGGDIAVDIALTASGHGYWIVQGGGRVSAFGDAAAIGTVAPTSGSMMISMESHAGKVWLLDNSGHVQVRNGAVSYGSYTPSFPVSTVITTNAVTSLRCTSTGLGYWILSADGHIQAFGDAGHVGDIAPLVAASSAWRDLYWELITVPSTNNGVLALKADGTIVPVGNVDPLDFYKGPAAGSAQLREDGNYTELSQIWRDLLLYSGFWLKETLGAADDPSVFGILETTGTWVNDSIPADQFDKKPIVDCIRMLTDIVGYIIREGDDGSAIITSPNIWQAGNFLEDGTHTGDIPEIDERISLTQYAVKLPASPIRSPITIASSKIDPHDPSATLHVDYTPPYAGLLHGMCRPAQWTNGLFTEPTEMAIMAELISLQIWFQLRTSSIAAWIDPAVEIDDQVRVLERQTSEVSILRVLEMHDSMDLDQGSWTMQLRTHWLGTDDSNWAVTASNVDTSSDVLPRRFQISAELADWMQKRTTERSIVGHRTLVPAWELPTIVAPGSQGGTGAASG